MGLEIDVRLLGPLEVEVAGVQVRLEGLRQRRLFTALALRAPDAVSADVLMEAVWGQPPAGAHHSLQKQVSRLRRRLGDGALPVIYRPAGYALDIDPQALDWRRFEDLLRRGKASLAAGDPAQAAVQLQSALALWRGEALSDHRYDEFAQAEIVRLEELRVEALEERLAAELATGHDADLVGDLQALVARYPLRERLRGHLMVALYRAGRQADALEVMRAGRQLMVDELGIEPGPDLRQLERMILAQDPGLRAEHAVVGLGARLPASANETIGRDGELAELRELLLLPQVRLITLVGPGGVGKTRLALDAARASANEFPAGAVHVNLDGAEDAAVLVPEAAAALGVVAATASELGERLDRMTHGARALLLLDGFDRYLKDAGQVAELLSAVENLTVLATSRGPLRLSAEHAFRVQPLAAPNAVALFCARARAVLGGRPIGEGASVGAICERLDGLPLAIELAADRARALPLPVLLARLERRLELLTGGPRDLPVRQRSLRATLELSWEALTEAERRLLVRLSVFEGGASLEAAHAVYGNSDDDLEALALSLLDKSSLLRTDSGRDDELRFAMLDTIREFAAEHLHHGEELSALERRHARYFLEYCERAAEQAARTDQREWLGRLAEERGNIRLAFERLLSAGRADEALRIAIAFARALPWDAHAHEVRGWLARALSAPQAAPEALRAQGLYSDGELALSQGLFADAGRQLQAALTAAGRANEAALQAGALAALGRRAVLVAAPEASELCEAAIAVSRRTGDPMLIADALLTAAGACERTQEWERADALAGEALELYRAAGDPYGAAWALAEQGWYAMVHSRLEQSERCLSAALDLRRRHGDDRRLVEPLIDHAWLMLVRHRGAEATRGFIDCLALARHVGDQFNMAEALAGLSTQAALQASWPEAARLAGASAVLHERIGAPPWESVSAMQERGLAGAREALGESAYRAAFEDGRRLSAEEAMELVQSVPASEAPVGVGTG